MDVQYIAGPLLGACIGYFTNFVAVKMLFRPHHPKMLCGRRLPFTPGIIPRRQPDLARAVGKAVGENLFTSQDLRSLLLSPALESSLVERAMGALQGPPAEQSIDQLAATVLGGAEAAQSKEKLVDALTGQIYRAALELDLRGLVKEQGRAFLEEKRSSLGMLAFLLNDSMFDPVLEQLGAQVEDYVQEHGRELLRPALQSRIDAFCARSVKDMLSGVEEEQLRRLITRAYEALIERFIDEFLERFHVAEIVEAKINAMDVKELERLVLSVMKHELNAIVNLGALIGFLLGLFNLLW
jgi:uncharacterized membrane protein YheB (UPF0754 family)